MLNVKKYVNLHLFRVNKSSIYTISQKGFKSLFDSYVYSSLFSTHNHSKFISLGLWYLNATSFFFKLVIFFLSVHDSYFFSLKIYFHITFIFIIDSDVMLVFETYMICLLYFFFICL